MKAAELSVRELFYYLGAMLLFAAKAIGLEERSLPFLILFALGALCIAAKMLLEAYTVSELLFFAALVGYGLYAFFHMGSVGLLSLMLLLIGMKNVPLRQLFRCLAIEYAFCFAGTLLLSLFGARDGVELIHEKFGHIVLRQSLGYTHPNVLHVTYVVLMALILYAANLHGKKLFGLIALLLAGDVFIFLYSLSNTGLLMSFALIGLVVYMEVMHCRKTVPIYRCEQMLLYLWSPIAFFGFIFLARIVALNNTWYVKANDIFNMRTWCINMYFDRVGLSLFGKRLSLDGVALDNSYAYALFAYGIVFFVLAFAAYVCTLRSLASKNRVLDIAIVVALMFGGITEQFLFNASIKNITIFLVGEWLFQSRFLEWIRQMSVLGKELSFFSESGLAERLAGISLSVPKKRFLFPTYVICAAVLLGIVFYAQSSASEPEQIYADPKRVDVGGVEPELISVLPDQENVYYIGNIPQDEVGELYVFTEENSAMIDQLSLYKRISGGCVIMGIIGAGIWLVRRERSRP